MKKFDSYKYWEKRYKSGGNSGRGSYGKNCSYKALVLNRFLKETMVETALELGCGDGNQLSYINYKKYCGFDISSTTIDICKNKFRNNENYFFTSNFNETPDKSEVTLSLDVIYHIIEDDRYQEYIDNLFNKSSKYVIIFSSNSPDNKTSEHVKHREFVNYVEKYISDFKLYKSLETPKEIYSTAGFYFFKKKNVIRGDK